MTRLALAAALALALAGCIPEEGPMMSPGEDCLDCHGGGDARAWSFAGTLSGSEGARVTVVDRNGRVLTVRANQAGNFYSAESLVFPLRDVILDGRNVSNNVTVMRDLPHGSCNRPTGTSGCHAGGGGGD